MPVHLANGLINVCVQHNPEPPDRTKMTIEHIKSLLELCMKNTYFLFQRQYYEQIKRTIKASIFIRFTINACRNTGKYHTHIYGTKFSSNVQNTHLKTDKTSQFSFWYCHLLLCLGTQYQCWHLYYAELLYGRTFSNSNEEAILKTWQKLCFQQNLFCFWEHLVLLVR